MANITLNYKSKASFNLSSMNGVVTGVVYERMIRAARATAIVIKEAHEERISGWNNKPIFEIVEDQSVGGGTVTVKVTSTDTSSSWWAASNFGARTAPNGIVYSRAPMPIANYYPKNSSGNAVKTGGIGRDNSSVRYAMKVGAHRKIASRNFIDNVFNEYRQKAIDAGVKELEG